MKDQPCSEIRPIVSVAIVTYNHEKYIEQAIQSVLNQNIDFPIEIIVGNDCSTDNTALRIKNQVNLKPEVFKVINHEVNVGALTNFQSVLKQCNGKFIALLDGDDYWTDNDKLKKQLKILMGNEGYILCQHETNVIDENGNLLRNTLWKENVPEIVSQRMLFQSQNLSQTSSWMFRSEPLSKMPDYLWNCLYDRVLSFYLASHGDFFSLKEPMSSYRLHPGGIHSLQKEKIKINQLISIYKTLSKNYRYYRDYRVEFRNRFKYYYSELAKNEKKDGKYLKSLISLSKSIYFTSGARQKSRSFLDYFLLKS